MDIVEDTEASRGSEWHRDCQHSATMHRRVDGQIQTDWVTIKAVDRTDDLVIAEWCRWAGQFMLASHFLDGEGIVIDNEC